jgi:hypothetical protein
MRAANLIVDPELVRINNALVQIDTPVVQDIALDAVIGDAPNSAAPAYRAHGA